MTARLYRLEHSQRLPLSMGDAWNFFSRPGNLERITPSNLAFEITSTLPPQMYAGMIVSYRVRPFGRMPVPWVTEITHLREPDFFVDEQRSGPYRFWHHQHIFRPIPAGVEMTDLVHYQLPLGWLSDCLTGKMVERRVASIFAYRRGVLAEMFGGMEVQS